jgi:hypothetical protein
VSGGGYGVGVPLPGKRIAATAASSAFAVGGKRPALDEEQGSAKRAKMASPDFDMTGGGLDEGVNTALQRLGFWKCRLCSAPKYLLAGAGRSPAAPCKWPLKDISKMITHFTEMHSEHSPPERCTELGAALAQNREYPPRGVKSRFSLYTPELANMWILGGPFEYWLRRTRAQNISDPSVIDDCFDTLLNGEMPDLLRRHSRAAAGMPAYCTTPGLPGPQALAFRALLFELLSFPGWVFAFSGYHIFDGLAFNSGGAIRIKANKLLFFNSGSSRQGKKG